MADIKTLVGFTGITTGHKWAVNDLPFIHDELVRGVSYGQDKSTGKLLEYFSRAKSDSYNIFTVEVLHYLACTGKFSDVLLRFPEGRKTKDSVAAPFLAGQNIAQIYNLESVLQYGKIKPTKIVLYTKGTYRLRVSVRLDFQGLMKGDNIFSQEVENNSADADFLTCHQFDLTGDEFIKKVNSKREDQLVIEIEVLSDSAIYPQTFITIDPTVEQMTKKFDITGGFSQGFSDGFSMMRGADLGITDPLISMEQGTVEFDVDAFISQNADKLAYCFAYRVGARLLGDKLTGVQLNIFTNSDPELTKMQLDQTEKSLKDVFKKTASGLLFNIQSTATPPIVLEGAVGYERGGFVDFSDGTYQGGRLTDDGAYPGYSGFL